MRETVTFIGNCGGRLLAQYWGTYISRIKEACKSRVETLAVAISDGICGSNKGLFFRSIGDQG